MKKKIPISLIVAVAENGVIGANNALPWHLPEDLKHFKSLTLGKPIIMGRKTCESLKGALPNRHNIVVSSNALNTPGFHAASSISEALAEAERYLTTTPSPGQTDEIMIIGGAQLYEASLPHIDKMYVTLVHLKPEGDTVFTAWRSEQWITNQYEGPFQAKNSLIPYTFLTLTKQLDLDLLKKHPKVTDDYV